MGTYYPLEDSQHSNISFCFFQGEEIHLPRTEDEKCLCCSYFLLQPVEYNLEHSQAWTLENG